MLGRIMSYIREGINYRYYSFKGRRGFKGPKPKVLNSEETLLEIKNNRRSLCRMGDGEFNIIFGGNIGFQAANSNLGYELRMILKDNTTKCLIGIPDIFDGLEAYRTKPRRFWEYYLGKHHKRIISLLDSNITYANTNVTRFQTGYVDSKITKLLIQHYKSIWNNKDVVFVEGEKTRLGVGNDLFSNTNSIARILVPAENAYQKKTEIIEYISKNIDRNKLLILACGPTATILAYELDKLGFWALDLGHIDIQYEYFLRNMVEKGSVPGKYVNESGQRNVEDCCDEKYIKSVIKVFEGE